MKDLNDLLIVLGAVIIAAILTVLIIWIDQKYIKNE